ncbi:hypothetical protein FEM48_Zijuj09G0120600 [Ziziphus jujuba var. spinosa]|uniref:TF-B3 domain-containing protein n=1 Tax=Ziziphus jujuba var. spinosa TaxID=714518 RepID=A0A978USW9_ZIZJJ|nr:hypothetical protein FEM48_Zijuj09G0120600 [Ziziphus jujuba var. spinosa]
MAVIQEQRMTMVDSPLKVLSLLDFSVLVHIFVYLCNGFFCLSLQSNRGKRPQKVEKLFRKKLSSLYQKTETHVRAYCASYLTAVSDRPVKSENNKRKRATAESTCHNAGARASVLEQAKEVQANLAPDFPSLVKTMLPSHVTGGFWLGLPKKFCHLHLPNNDMMITLEDENKEVYETKYLLEKVGLSGGWRGFSIADKLLEGDVLVFHLVTPSKFKFTGTFSLAKNSLMSLLLQGVLAQVLLVYIVRLKCSDEMDCALGLLKLEACVDRMDIAKLFQISFCSTDIKHADDTDACQKETVGGLKSLSYDNPEGEILDQSDNENTDIISEVLDGIRLSDSVVSCQEVRSFKDFNVLVNGLIIDSEISKYLKAKYYELCCSQKTFLYEYLLEGLNCKLAAGIILETMNIADAIRSSKITTSKDDFIVWDKTLKCFEVLEAELRNLEAKLLVAKQTMNRLDTKIELIFQEVASAP